MNASQFDRILRQATLIPAVALLLAPTVLFLGLRAANRTVRVMDQADQCISETNLLQKLMVDEETGMRGYQVTRDPQFLSR